MNLSDLTQGERFIVEWQYRMLGGFHTKLMEVIAHADDNNQWLLSKGFPEEVKAFQQFNQIDGWWEKVQIKAGIKKGV